MAKSDEASKGNDEARSKYPLGHIDPLNVGKLNRYPKFYLILNYLLYFS